MKEIHFNEIPIGDEYGRPLKKVYSVAIGDKSEVINVLLSLEPERQDSIKELISKMATVPNYKSDSIQWNLKKYKYGEVKPKPQRFFFFQEVGNAIIFFDAVMNKDQNSLGDAFYKSLEKKREKLSDEFKKRHKTD